MIHLVGCPLAAALLPPPPPPPTPALRSFGFSKVLRFRWLLHGLMAPRQGIYQCACWMGGRAFLTSPPPCSTNALCNEHFPQDGNFLGPGT